MINDAYKIFQLQDNQNVLKFKVKNGQYNIDYILTLSKVFNNNQFMSSTAVQTSQGIGPKFLYPRNWNDSLNHFQFFEIRKSLAGKSYCDFKPRNST